MRQKVHHWKTKSVKTLPDGNQTQVDSFPEFRPFLKREAVVRAADKTRSNDRAAVAETEELLPNDWDVSEGASDALIDLRRITSEMYRCLVRDSDSDGDGDGCVYQRVFARKPSS